MRVAVTGAANNGVFRGAGAEAALARDVSAAAIGGRKVTERDRIADLHGTAAYRAKLGRVLTGRAVSAA